MGIYFGSKFLLNKYKKNIKQYFINGADRSFYSIYAKCAIAYLLLDFTSYQHCEGEDLWFQYVYYFRHGRVDVKRNLSRTTEAS